MNRVLEDSSVKTQAVIHEHQVALAKLVIYSATDMAHLSESASQIIAGVATFVDHSVTAEVNGTNELYMPVILSLVFFFVLCQCVTNKQRLRL